ncbi:hypothetical protein DV736_g2035, partial [Chaetothyriales sp. CBS 134916]
MQCVCVRGQLLLRASGFGLLARCPALGPKPACPSSALHSRLQQTQSRFSSYRYRRFGAEDGRQQHQEQTWSRFRPVFRAQYVWRNYRGYVIGIGVVGGLVYVTNLEKVPFTGRWRFNIVSPELEKQMAAASYDEILAQFGSQILPADHPYTILTARVVERLLPASGLANSGSDGSGNGSGSGSGDDEWRVHVIDEPSQMNAFVIPGGKVFVFTGILPVAQDEAGLATILGHEIAHNVAHHAAERLSSSGFVLLFAIAASLIFDVSGGLAQSLADLLLTLPNSRTQEIEADHIGLLIMAESCYPPAAAVDLWTRMDNAQKVAAPPQFLSTHPTNYNRRELIRGWLPQAEAKYDDAQCGLAHKHLPSFRDILGAIRRADDDKPKAGRAVHASGGGRGSANEKGDGDRDFW